MADITETQESLPPFRMGEVGSLGLKVKNGRIYEEPRQALRFPESIKTFQLMMRDPAVAASVNIIKMFVRKVNWRFVPPKGKEQDPKMLERADFFNSLMDDMEHDWADFINSVMSFCTYGFCVNEKVYKKRQGKKGKYQSKFDDGLIGWAKLPIRNQSTLDKWYFDEDFRKVTGVRQNLRNVSHIAGAINLGERPLTRKLPRAKFMLFKYDDEYGNPEGRSPLLNAYVPWKYKVQIEEYEAVGVSRDLVGMPKIGLPPDYLDENAEPEKKAFVQYCKTVVNDMIANDRAGLIWPRYIDPDTKEDISLNYANGFFKDKKIKYCTTITMKSIYYNAFITENGKLYLVDSNTKEVAFSSEENETLKNKKITNIYYLGNDFEEQYSEIITEDGMCYYTEDFENYHDINLEGFPNVTMKLN